MIANPPVGTAQMLLEELRTRLDRQVTWELKRHLVEVLVGGIRVETVDGDEGKFSRTTVSYQFSPAGDGVPLILPQSYGARSTIEEPGAVGNHLRKRRVALRLRQRDVAAQVGVDVTTLRNWERNRTVPDLHVMPAITEFLGNQPMPEPTGAGEQLVWQCTAKGILQPAAREIGVDPSTLTRYEQGLRPPRPPRLTWVKHSWLQTPVCS